MAILDCLDRNDLIPIMTNVLFFMIVQTLFFKYIASKQFEVVLESKLDFLKVLSEENPKVKRAVDDYKVKFISNNKDIVKNQERLREEDNMKTTKTYLGIPILIGSLIFLHLIFIMSSKRSWNSVDTLAVLFVALAYATEIIFFFSIVRQYEFVGDHYIMNKVLKDLSK
jgi:hypothetical protein